MTDASHQIWLLGTELGDKLGSEKETDGRTTSMALLPSYILSKKFPELQHGGSRHTLQNEQDTLAQVSIPFLKLKALNHVSADERCELPVLPSSSRTLIACEAQAGERPLVDALTSPLPGG